MVRGLRTQLVKELSDEAEGRYELSLDIEKARLRRRHAGSGDDARSDRAPRMRSLRATR